MTGDGDRCSRWKRAMAGVGDTTTETNKTDSISSSPNFVSEITEQPLGSPHFPKLPLTSTVDFDFYTQACKTLSFRSPVDSQDPAASVSVSSANTLPSGISHFLSSQSDSRKRHKKAHSGSENKSSIPGRLPGPNIWPETEEYFQELTISDIECLYRVYSAGFSETEKCFLIPSLGENDSLCRRYDAFNRILAHACKRESLNLADEVEDRVVQEENEPCFLDMDGGETEINQLEFKEENTVEKKEKDAKDFMPFGGVEWILGSRSKIYLASDRSSKKRKLLVRDSGLEKLLVAHPTAKSDSLCHCCSYGDIGDPLNCLIKCGSCGMVVHQRCYGVQEDVDSSWLCSWCRWKNDVGLSIERPCVLCPKQGGALKPVQKKVFESKIEGSDVEFAHLYCCQWMPELYVENTRVMEPIKNFEELNNSRKKLVCSLCKVKWGACVRCSTGGGQC